MRRSLAIFTAAQLLAACGGGSSNPPISRPLRRVPGHLRERGLHPVEGGNQSEATAGHLD
jgi:hypothetical protein